MGKEFYNANVQIFEKTQYKLLFNIFHNEDICRWTVQLYIKKRYVETIYTMEIIL